MQRNQRARTFPSSRPSRRSQEFAQPTSDWAPPSHREREYATIVAVGVSGIAGLEGGEARSASATVRRVMEGGFEPG